VDNPRILNIGRYLVLALVAFAAGASWSSAFADQSERGLIFGQKVTALLNVKNVVGPTVHVDDKGQVALAWMEEDKEIRRILFAKPEASGFGKPVQVNLQDELPYFRQEAPAFVTKDDQVFLTWAAMHRKAEPDKPFSNELRLSRSADAGNSFLPSVLVNDDGQVINHSFDSIHLTADGTLHMTWIDGRDGKKDPGTFTARSTDLGQTIDKNLKVDDSTCVCCRTSLTSGPDGTLYLAWRKMFPGDIRETVVAHSSDNGRTFSAPAVVGNDRWVFAGCPHRPASIGTDRQGRLYVAWYTEGQDETPAIYLAHSDDHGRTFSPKHKLNVARGTFPDHPQLAVDPEGRVVVTWEEQSPVRREVVMSVSLDRGQTFTNPRKMNDKKGQSPSVSVNRRGLVALAWMEHAMPAHKIVVQTMQLPLLQVTAQDALPQNP
jgi:hypothetical protein